MGDRDAANQAIAMAEMRTEKTDTCQSDGTGQSIVRP